MEPAMYSVVVRECLLRRLVVLSLFAAPGVVEAIAAPGMVLVRIGRLFGWEEAEPAVAAALAQ